MLTLLMKFLKVLNSEQSSNQLAFAISFSAILGLTPLLSLHNAIICIIVLSFRINLTLLMISYPLFALIGYLLSPTFESVGLLVLQEPQLLNIWESFFNTLIGRWSNFYYSGVMGSFVISIILSVILFPIVKLLVHSYRNNWKVNIEKLKVVKVLKASKLWQFYHS